MMTILQESFNKIEAFFDLLGDLHMYLDKYVKIIIKVIGYLIRRKLI